MTAPAVQQTIVGDHNIVTGTGDVRIVYELPPAEADERRLLLVLLERVRQFWVVGALDGSVHGAALLELGTAPVGGAVAHPWAQFIELPSRATHAVASDVPVEALFDQAGRALLILGAEGSGKTTVLLQLARGLIPRAERDPAQPIPVVLSLASWAGSADSLLPWLVAELQSKYFVPPRIARSWVERQRLAILLDGLDEVEEAGRQECVAAVNRFLAEVGAAGIAVCSRLQEYMAQPERLAFGAAVRLEPLTAEQVRSYVSAGGPRLEGLRLALTGDPVLRELASSPLLLSVMSLAYQDAAVPVAPEQGHASVEERRTRIFESYVQRMFARRGGERARYGEPDTLRWLGGLAGQMLRHGQRVLLVESLQPNYLETWVERGVYVLLSRAATGLALGGMEGIYLFSLTRMSPPEAWMRAAAFWQVMLAGLFMGLLFGLAVGAVDWLRLRPTRIDGQSGSPEPLWRTAAVVALYWGLFAALLGILGIGMARAPFGLIWALLFALRGRRQSLEADVQPVLGLAWSWRRAARGGLYGLLVGVAIGVLVVVISPEEASTAYPVYFLLYALLGAAFGGVTRTVGESPMPGRGIRVTIRAAMRGGLLTAAVPCLLFPVAMIVIIVIGWTLPVDKFQAFTAALTPAIAATGLPVVPVVVLGVAALAGLIVGMLVGLYFGLLGALWYGGADAIQHAVLRSLLWRRGAIPWRLPRFLDFCTRLIFLQRVGGGYRFVHGALMAHFARRGDASRPT